jgi:hypothetical protein
VLDLNLTLGVVDASLCAAMAAAVYAVAPDRAVDRALAALLLFEGATQLAAGLNRLAYDAPAPDVPTIVGLGGVFIAAMSLDSAAYLLVIRSLDTPLVRPLRGRAATILLVAAGLALAGLAAWEAPRSFADGRPPLDNAPLYVLGLVAAFGIVASASAFLRAPRGSTRRRQARAFLLAFGVRDSIFLSYVLNAILPGRFPFDTIAGIATPFLATLLFVPLMAYGILQANLFDIDLKIKWTLRRGSLVALFVAAFFVVSAIAEQYLQQYGPLVGGLAVGLLLFALHPIERVVDRFADRAMPGVGPSGEYLAFRKLEVYRAALESAYESGGVSPKERESLGRLASKLDIRREDATAVEADVQARRSPAAA